MKQKKAAQRAPAGLGPRGRRLWRETARDHHLEVHQHVILHEACRVADRLDLLDEAMAGEGVAAVLDEAGEDGELVVLLKIDRALAEARQQQNILKQLVASLRLPDEDGVRPQRRGPRGAYKTGGQKHAPRMSALDRARASR